MTRLGLSDGDRRNLRTPPTLTAAFVGQVEAAGLRQCSQCSKRVPDNGFVPYINNFSYIRKKSERPDPETLAKHGDGECWQCFDGTSPSATNAKCVRCGRGWGGYTHCPNCRGRVR